MVSALQFSLNGDQFLGREYKPNNFDCQDFVEQVMKTVGIYENLPGSNAWYRKMTWVGTPEECISKFGSVPKGALLFILEQNGKEPEKYKADGIGNASHIGIKTGRTQAEMMSIALKNTSDRASLIRYSAHGSGAIHSSATWGHVATSNFNDKTIKGGWNRVGLWDRFDYGDKINSILSGQDSPQDKKQGEKVTIVITQATVTGGSLNLRALKSTSSDKLTSIPNGSTVSVSEKGDTWSKVTYGSQTGYVMTRYLSFDNNDKISMTIDRDHALALYEALKAALNS